MTPDARAFITGCAGPVLSVEERAFMRRYQPWGLIVFRRNVDTPEALSALTSTFRELVGRADAPVLIDQEGGRVQRLTAPRWPKYPAARTFAGLGRRRGLETAALSARLMASDLAAVGVNVDCLPVLDVPAADGNEIIGDRAYADNPADVALFGRAVAEAMLAMGVLPVVKHIPGNGRARVDSHLELPVVTASRADLEAVDFAPFRALADMPLGMTAHVVYTALDPAAPATLSRTVVRDIIRGFIGFDGLLMTDDLSMKALAGGFAERARAAFVAGVDVALHCNGDMREAEPVAEVSPMLAGRSLERAESALRRVSGPRDPIVAVDARAKLDLALAALA